MAYKYAVIKDGKVVGISKLSGPVAAADHIPLTDGEDVHGKLWDGAKFVEDATPPPEPPPPSKTIEDVLVKLAELETKLNAIDTKRKLCNEGL